MTTDPAEPWRESWPALLEALGEPAWIVDARGLRVVAVNDAALTLLARTRDSVIGRPAEQLLATPEDQALWDEVRAGAQPALLSDAMAADASGRVLQLTRWINPIVAAGEPAAHYLVRVSDQSERARERDERETLLAELQATLESTADGILVTDLAGRIRAFNRRFAQIWGMPQELLLSHMDDAVYGWMRRSVADPESYARRLAALQEATMQHACERLTLLSGQVLEMLSQPQCSRGRPIGRVWAFRDLSEQLAADRRIEALSTTDLLTGLPNRRQLAEALATAIACARRDGEAFSLLLMDLDRFKHINDSLGHALGDRVLVEVTSRLLGCLRQGDLAVRMGGDQFAVLLHHTDGRSAEVAARRLLEATARAYTLEGMQFTLTCSVGVALHPTDGDSGDELVRNAETAMQSAKRAGRASYRFYQPRHDADLLARMRLDHAMRQALASNRFRLAFQPQVDIHSGAVVGAEALIRWRDPERGDVAPGQFIPVAEDSGFIVAIGDWVLTQAVRQAARWRERGFAVPVAVNVSALQFQQADFVERVAAALAGSALPGASLELELTESILVHDAAEALQRLQALARLGVALSIDDFGTGYSSLAYLKRFPIERLKIDRSFIRGLPADDSDAGIVRAIIQMARALNLKVVAEGVETEPQRQFLLDAGCDQFQGFLYAPALDAVSFEQRLRAPTPSERGRLRVVNH